MQAIGAAKFQKQFQTSTIQQEVYFNCPVFKKHSM